MDIQARRPPPWAPCPPFAGRPPDSQAEDAPLTRGRSSPSAGAGDPHSTALPRNAPFGRIHGAVTVFRGSVAVPWRSGTGGAVD